MKGSKWALIGLAMLFVLVAAFLALVSQNKGQLDKPAAPKMVEEKLSGPVDIGSKQKQIEESKKSIVLANVSGGGGSGSASMGFDGEKYLHTISANLPLPAEGQFYEGWLVSQTGDLPLVSTGKLTNVEGKQFALVFSDSRDLSAYDTVVVTIEGADDGEPETHILEGKF